MNAFQTMTSMIPAPIRRSLLDTPVEAAFRQLEKHTITLSTLSPRSPIGTFSLRAPPDSIIAEIIDQSGTYEPALTVAMSDRIDESSVVYDVGSRYGYYSTLAVAAGARPENVHCFEADVVAHHVLSGNHRDEGVVTNRIRVGSESGGSRVTLDDYADRNSPPTLVKIDTEGAETDILRGTSNVLRTHRPALFVEMHPHRGVSTPSVFDFLRRHGYELSIFSSHHIDDVEEQGSADQQSEWGDTHERWQPVDVTAVPSDRTFLLRALPVSKD